MTTMIVVNDFAALTTFCHKFLFNIMATNDFFYWTEKTELNTQKKPRRKIKRAQKWKKNFFVLLNCSNWTHTYSTFDHIKNSRANEFVRFVLSGCFFVLPSLSLPLFLSISLFSYPFENRSLADIFFTNSITLKHGTNAGYEYKTLIIGNHVNIRIFLVGFMRFIYIY